MKNITIHTDGSCLGNPGPGGYGAILMYGGHRKKLSGGFSHTTNNRMEIFAAIAALESLKEPCGALIYSDSSYLVNAVKSGWIANWKANGWRKSNKKSIQNVDLWKRLDAMLLKHQVSFEWVKGHADNEQNNLCDVLARQAASSKNLSDDTGYNIEQGEKA